jgi:hypothetical protein
MPATAEQSCCRHCSSGESGHSCCAAKHGGEQRHAPGPSDGQPTVTTAACHCRPASQTAVVVPAGKVSLADPLPMNCVVPDVDSNDVDAIWQPAAETHNTGPPLDLTVTLRRLVI